MDEYITTEETAERLKVTPQTVARYIKDGKLNAVKIGKSYRIRASDVAQLLGLPANMALAQSAQVIAICNQKRGSGKTTTAINLATALGGKELGKRTLLIDLDPQNGCAAALGIGATDVETMYGVLSNAAPIAKAIIRTDFGFDLVPANIELAGAEFELKQKLLGEAILRRRLEPLLERYDFILIDCPCSLGLLTLNALAAANNVIVPVSGDDTPQKGLEMLLKVTEDVKSAINSRLQIAGVLVTQYKPTTPDSKETVQTVSEFCRTTSTRLFPFVIKQSVNIAESSSFQKPFILLHRSEDSAEAYMQVAQELDAATASPLPSLDGTTLDLPETHSSRHRRLPAKRGRAARRQSSPAQEVAAGR